MKLEVGDVTRIARRRWYLTHRKEFYAGMVVLLVAAALFVGCIAAGDDGLRSNDDSNWVWTHGAVALLTLTIVTLAGWAAWLVWWAERRNDFIREFLNSWVDGEVKQGQVRDKKGKFAAKKNKKASMLL